MRVDVVRAQIGQAPLHLEQRCTERPVVQLGLGADFHLLALEGSEHRARIGGGVGRAVAGFQRFHVARVQRQGLHGLEHHRQRGRDRVAIVLGGRGAVGVVAGLAEARVAQATEDRPLLVELDRVARKHGGLIDLRRAVHAV